MKSREHYIADKYVLLTLFSSFVNKCVYTEKGPGFIAINTTFPDIQHFGLYYPMCQWKMLKHCPT